MKVLLGQKMGMSQMFSPEGEVIPVTLIQAQPNQVTLKRTAENDGYSAVQVALPKKSNNKDNLVRPFSQVREFKGSLDTHDDILTVQQFNKGEFIQVSGISKGKGFQGVVKRHGFKGGPASHGHTDWERRPGSIGQRFPQHTIKGKRMASRMGATRVTVKGLQIVAVDPALNLLAVKGAVPGRIGTVLEVRSFAAKV